MTIKQKLWLMGLMAILGLLTIFVVDIVGSNLMKEAMNIEEKAFHAEISMLQSRRSEKDFLMRKDLKYISIFKESSKTMQTDLEALKGSSLNELAIEGLNYSSMYVDSFLKVTEDHIRLGLSENDGLQKQLRDTIHLVEKVILEEDSSLEVMVHKLRRNEKDFIMRQDGKYLDKFKSNILLLTTRINESDYSPKITELLLKHLNLYQDDMNNYAQLSLKIKSNENKFRKTVHKMEPILEKLALEAESFLNARQSQITYTIFGVEIVTAIILLLTIALIIRSILTQLDLLQKCARDVSEGKYEACEKIKLTGELETLRNIIAQMVVVLKQSMDTADQKSIEADHQAENAKKAMKEAHSEKEYATSLLDTMSTISDQAATIAVSLNSAAEELSMQAKGIKDGADNQRDRTQETATAVDEMSATILEVARNSSDASTGTIEASNKAQEGSAIVEEVVSSTEEVQARTKDLKNALAEQSTRANAIGQIMSVISDIADQTNLLALNAAIEAARAGDAGRGFAVVADEVRKLAEKTMVATQEVGTAITGIQTGTTSSLNIMTKTETAVTVCAEQATKAGDALKSIVDLVTESADRVQSIATAAEEQSAACEQINVSTMEINTISTETSASVDQSIEAVEDITKLASDLHSLIEKLNNCQK
ncbi:methyl-accepting chemotaxis protein [Maridesulfovibrio ferrireducens]|uniref:Methyl-accepting chemotaxis protein n=1 Tax=Maridesulfovibrio ferrireducens TaxID=246191 RepID=A0A1G9F4P5_9BACT|nr:methyl-accepting chemotaxis protein [Maridesulfovibrio ferrireducens]SDK83321.1 methyl-accepting chemotaxis protein [Maridesulfovibrio ferrireducens]